MDGIWFKRCPQCSNYMHKADPTESCMCCACGWEEYSSTFYCEVIHNYCSCSRSSDEKDVSLVPVRVPALRA